LKFDTNIHRQQAPFSGAVAGEQVIKIRSLLLFVNNFQFYFVFLHLLTFDHPQNQSNLVWLTLVFLDLFLFSVLYIFCLLLTLTGDGDEYLSNKPYNFADDPENLYRLRRREAQAKKLEFADPKAGAERSSESPKESPPQSPRENRLHRWDNNPSWSARSGSYAP
jgi:hypothetical protein